MRDAYQIRDETYTNLWFSTNSNQFYGVCSKERVTDMLLGFLAMLFENDDILWIGPFFFFFMHKWL